MDSNTVICALCGRPTPVRYLEKHHLIPVVKGGKGGGTIKVCCDCAKQVHKLFTILQLRDTFNTIEALLSDERMQTWIKWIRKQKSFGICMKSKKRR